MNSNFLWLLNCLPIGALRRAAGVNPLIINYHVVSDKRLPHIIHLYNYRNIAAFNRDLDFFCRHYHMIGLPDLLESLVNRTKLPENSLLITFDDGFREIYDVVAPVLIKRKLTTTVFITKNFLDNQELNYDNKKSLLLEVLSGYHDDKIRNKIHEILKEQDLHKYNLTDSILEIPYTKRHVVDILGQLLQVDYAAFLKNDQPYLTTQEVRKLLNEGFTFGAHGIDHARFSELGLEDQLRQTFESTDFISQEFSLDYRVFAFPYTDSRISVNYFSKISEKIHATFGTQGLLKDCIPTNFQRISVEKFSHSANKTVKYNYLRKCIYKLMQKDLIKRSVLHKCISHETGRN